MTTIRYRVRFGRPERPVRSPRPRADAVPVSVPEPPPPKRPDPRASAAQLLAVAHFVERGLIDGSIPSFDHAVALVGVSRSRLSQIMKLLDLGAAVQEAVLVGEGVIAEHGLRRMTREVIWSEFRYCQRMGQ